jgi:biopolymer transport protein ExbB
MKKLFAFFAVVSLLFIGASLYAQETKTDSAAAQTTVDSATAAQTEVKAEGTESAEAVAVVEEETSTHQDIKKKFIEGGASFMASVLLTLIVGLAIAIERIIYLSLASTNTDKLLRKIEAALNEGGVEAAKDVCRVTPGPVASIFYQGLDRAHEGIDIVEKSVVAYGGVQASQLEKGLTWISLMIGLAPMLGFMGTVVGMIDAFDSIQAAGDISPTLVAGGIKVALITTVGGLIVAIILQVFYNFIVSKVDNIVNKMEDASISLIDLLVKFNQK